ncbi:hypothetical protein MMC10_001607 [Thelotrema lepadinum]|nr:hypothetical protein [Thelotrema lepadinum]
MLDWITGAHRSAEAHDGLIDEPPETPAHLFAVKAFKTALWGTPAPYTVRQHVDTSRAQKDARSGTITEVQDEPELHEQPEEVTSPLAKARHADPFASPTKGILVTPGASVSKRKTVSFGGLPKHAGNASNNPQVHKESKPAQASKLSRADLERKAKEDLRRSLFEAKAKKALDNEEIRKETAKETDPVQAQLSKPQRETLEAAGVANNRADQSPDVTVDLQCPRSKSGKHWKQEYQRDHDNSKAEMKKLIQYSQVAKSFAEKRDGDALRLSEKWKNAETKVKDMEAKVSDLAAQLMGAQVQDERQMELVNEVASQTAKALRFKQKAEKYKLALYNEKPIPDSTDDEAEARLGSINQYEGELSRFKSEVSHLQKAAGRAESRASEVEKENMELKKTLLRVKEEMKKFEVRNREREERRKKKEEKAAAQKKELEDALEKANAQNTALQQELDSLRTANTDPAIDRIQHMRNRLRGLEYTKSPETTSPPYINPAPAISPPPKELSKPSIVDTPQHERPRSRRRDSVFELTLTSPEPPTTTVQANFKSSPPLPMNRNSRVSSSTNEVEDIWTTTLPSPPASPQRSSSSPTIKGKSKRNAHRVLSPLIGNTPSASPSHANANPSRASFMLPSPIPPSSYPRPTTGESKSASLGRRTERPLSNQNGPGTGNGIGERRSSLPPDRAAAARRRIEERMAERRSSREKGQGKVSGGGGGGKENEEPKSP